MREFAIRNNYDYYCFMHNDGESMDNSVNRLVEKADQLIHNNINWSIIFTHYDVLCAYSTKCVKQIGEWGDPLWPAQQTGYYLDNDYYRRMDMDPGKFIRYQLEDCNVLHNSPSNTIKDTNESKRWNQQQEHVLKHYIRKWGGSPGNETVTNPPNFYV